MALSDRPIGLWIFLTTLLLSIGLGRGHFIGTDEIAVYQQTRSLWLRGDLAIGRINNTFQGRDGRWYSQYGSGQSILALPLYAMGAVVKRMTPDPWPTVFAGPQIGVEPSRWGGDVEIFYVNLFNAFVTAGLCVLFYRFSRALDTGPRASALAALLLGTTTHLSILATQFLQHSLEAFLTLGAFYLLFRDRQEPSAALRAMAGSTLGLLVNTRIVAVLVIPALGLYLLSSIVRRHGWRIRPILVESCPLGLALLPFLAFYAWINELKFGTWAVVYNHEGFNTPLLHGLYGFLLSPGMSIFVFSPLLCLVPWMGQAFYRTHRAEALAVLGIALTYLLYFSKYTMWHGLWSAVGPRYLAALIPLLLLPLGRFLDRGGRHAVFAVAPLAFMGFVMQILGTSVNFAYLYHAQGWPSYRPPYSFLFIPNVSPPAALWWSFWAHEHIDLWLMNTWRNVGAGYALVFLVPLALLLFYGLGRVWALTAPHSVSDSRALESEVPSA